MKMITISMIQHRFTPWVAVAIGLAGAFLFGCRMLSTSGENRPAESYSKAVDDLDGLMKKNHFLLVIPPSSDRTPGTVLERSRSDAVQEGRLRVVAGPSRSALFLSRWSADDTPDTNMQLLYALPGGEQIAAFFRSREVSSYSLNFESPYILSISIGQARYAAIAASPDLRNMIEGGAPVVIEALFVSKAKVSVTSGTNTGGGLTASALSNAASGQLSVSLYSDNEFLLEANEPVVLGVRLRTLERLALVPSTLADVCQCIENHSDVFVDSSTNDGLGMAASVSRWSEALEELADTLGRIDDEPGVERWAHKQAETLWELSVGYDPKDASSPAGGVRASRDILMRVGQIQYTKCRDHVSPDARLSDTTYRELQVYGVNATDHRMNGTTFMELQPASAIEDMSLDGNWSNMLAARQPVSDLPERFEIGRLRLSHAVRREVLTGQFYLTAQWVVNGQRDDINRTSGVIPLYLRSGHDSTATLHLNIPGGAAGMSCDLEFKWIPEQ